MVVVVVNSDSVTDWSFLPLDDVFVVVVAAVWWSFDGCPKYEE